MRLVRPDLELSSRPLYDQIANLIRKRISTDAYRPGTPIPGEVTLASELSVSQGTVRKALDVLVNEQILFRRQGLGTFVSENASQRLHCLYFNISRDDGGKMRPDSRVLSLTTGFADQDEQAKLEISAQEQVIRLRRLRYFDQRCIIIENLSISSALFPGMSTLSSLPEILYPYYQSEHGVIIGKVREQVKAIAASADDAAYLDVPEGAPLLHIDRVALSMKQTIVEWRRITCLSDYFHFGCERT